MDFNINIEENTSGKLTITINKNAFRALSGVKEYSRLRDILMTHILMKTYDNDETRVQEVVTNCTTMGESENMMNCLRVTKETNTLFK